MSLSISGELCRCSASRFWGLTGEPKSDTCIFKIKQFFAAGTSCVFVYVFTFYKQWPVWFPCCCFQMSVVSWSRQFFPPFLSGTRLSTVPHALTRPGMDRKMEFLAPYTPLPFWDLNGADWLSIRFTFTTPQNRQIYVCGQKCLGAACKIIHEYMCKREW